MKLVTTLSNVLSYISIYESQLNEVYEAYTNTSGSMRSGSIRKVKIQFFRDVRGKQRDIQTYINYLKEHGYIVDTDYYVNPIGQLKRQKRQRNHCPRNLVPENAIDARSPRNAIVAPEMP
jgi:hypothetical protein